MERLGYHIKRERERGGQYSMRGNCSFPSSRRHSSVSQRCKKKDVNVGTERNQDSNLSQKPRSIPPSSSRPLICLENKRFRNHRSPLRAGGVLGQPVRTQCAALDSPDEEGGHLDPADAARAAAAARGAHEDVDGHALDGQLFLALDHKLNILGNAGGLLVIQRQLHRSIA